MMSEDFIDDESYVSGYKSYDNGTIEKKRKIMHRLQMCIEFRNSG